MLVSAGSSCCVNFFPATHVFIRQETSHGESVSTLGFGSRVSEITLGAAKKNVETAALLRTKETLVQAQQQAAEERMAAERLRDELDARERALCEAAEQRAAMERKLAELEVCKTHLLLLLVAIWLRTRVPSLLSQTTTQSRLEHTSIHAVAGPRHAPSSGMPVADVSTPKSLGRLSLRGTPVSMHEPVSTPPSSRYVGASKG